MRPTYRHVLDEAVLLSFLPEVQSDPEIAREEITFFIAHLRKHQMSFVTGLKAKDWGQIDENAHRLASNAAMFGLNRLAGQCRRIERAMGQGDVEQMSDITRSVLGHLEEEIAALKSVLPDPSSNRD